MTERSSLASILFSAGAAVFWSTARISTFWSSVIVLRVRLPPPLEPWIPTLVMPLMSSTVNRTSTLLPGKINPATPEAIFGVWIVKARIPL